MVVGLYVVDAHPGVDSHPGDPENVSLLGHPPSGFCDGVHGDIGLRECGHDRELPVIAPSDYPPQLFPRLRSVSLVKSSPTPVRIVQITASSKEALQIVRKM